MIERLVTLLVLFALAPLPLNGKEVESYHVRFEGAIPSDVEKKLVENSQLVRLQNHPPATKAGLKRRSESDLSNLVLVMHNFAYYNAHITFRYNYSDHEAEVVVVVDPGSIYPLAEVIIEGGLDEAATSCSIGSDATPALLNQIEKETLRSLHCSGYPFPEIEKRVVLADQESKSVTLKIEVNKGPLARFGPLWVSGNRSVKDGYFRKHLAWKEGMLYCPSAIDETVRRLELGQLFTSVSIKPLEEMVGEDESLPICITVHEAKQRSIGAGVNYASQRGPGFSGEWEHRNFGGMGERLAFRTNLWHDEQYAKLSYLQPDIFCYRQNLEWLAELYREKTEGYTTRSLSFGATFSRPLFKRTFVTYGLKYVFLHDTDIHEKHDHEAQKTDDERFHLIKAPLSYSYDCSDDLLDPSRGFRFKLKLEPTCQLLHTPFVYSINTLRLTHYLHISKRPDLVFASAVTIGSIPGPKKTTIPRSELFDAGTSELLRGYRYKSVSPLDNEYDPTGGRSMMIYSFEMRWRMTKTIGLVTFYDFGNVYSTILPNFGEKLLQSVGFGFRYYTPVGPIRLDIAFPLTPRRHVDKSRYQAYLSIGQTF